MAKKKSKSAKPTEQCGTCRAYHMQPDNAALGTCHLNPPSGQINPASAASPGATWSWAFPVVTDADWCSHWKP
jgi:hypothetical protein